MKCFHCGKLIKGLRSFLPLERPYVNLPFHRDCYTSIDDELAYVTKHYERILEYIALIRTKKYRLERKKNRNK